MAVLTCWLLLAAAVAAQAQVLVLRGVSLIDPAGGRAQPDQNIVIRDGRIESVAAASRFRPPRGARVIDGRGKYVIPGLIDAHVHLIHRADFAHLTPDELLPMYLAYGVTSLRDTGDEVVAEKFTERYAQAHPDSSPRIFLCSPLIDGDPPFHADIGRPLTDPEKVPEFVADMKAWGVTSLKLYVRMNRDVGRLVIQEGHKAGLVVIAHLGRYSAQDAVADGIDVLEHIVSVFSYGFPQGSDTRSPQVRAALDLHNPAAQALRDLIVQHKTTIDPTLAVYRNMLLLNDLPEIHDHPDNALVPQRLKDEWTRYRTRSNLPAATRDLRRQEFRKYQELTGLLYRAGVPILAGTDAPEPYVPPGAALHQELEMLVESGLTPAAALTAATLNNARAIRQQDQLGSIAPGKLADLVVLSANPLEDIRNTRKIVQVIKGGRAQDPAALLALLPKQ